LVKSSHEVNNGSLSKMGFTKVDGKWVSKDGDQAGLLEFMALNKRGGELFINDIHKL